MMPRAVCNRPIYALVLLANVLLAGSGTGNVRAAQGDASIRRCYTSQLSLAPAGSTGAAGHLALELRFTNHSRRTCTLFGYPGVRLLDGQRRPLPTALHWGSGIVPGMQPRRLVLLVPGGHAFFVLDWSHIPGPQQTCPAARYLSVIPPNTRTPLVVGLGAGGVDACGGRINISPVVATQIPI